MKMNCDKCGDGIFVSMEYYHDTLDDTNYHLNCIPVGMQDVLEKKYREE